MNFQVFPSRFFSAIQHFYRVRGKGCFMSCCRGNTRCHPRMWGWRWEQGEKGNDERQRHGSSSEILSCAGQPAAGNPDFSGFICAAQNFVPGPEHRIWHTLTRTLREKGQTLSLVIPWGYFHGSLPAHPLPLFSLACWWAAGPHPRCPGNTCPELAAISRSSTWLPELLKGL